MTFLETTRSSFRYSRVPPNPRIILRHHFQLFLGLDYTLTVHCEYSAVSTYNLLLTATSAFVVVGSNFFINKIEFIFLSQFVKMAIVKLKDVAVNVQSVTCDEPSTNICALKHLGCSFPENPYFNLDGVSHDINLCAFGSFTCSNYAVML